MPKIDNFHILPEQEELFNKSCVLRPGFYGDKIDKKHLIFRKRNFESLSQQSTFPDIATAWGLLSDREKALWEEAGFYAEMSAWDLFSMDLAYRMANGIEGTGIPDRYHQYFVGRIKIESPASSIIIRQYLLISAPRQFSLGINYLNQMSQTSASHYIFYAVGFSLWDVDEWIIYYSGFYCEDEWHWYFDFDDFDWTGYTLKDFFIEIDIYNMRGTFFFDGLFFNYNDVNWIEDWQCDDIGWMWEDESVPAGASYESLYWRNSFWN